MTMKQRPLETKETITEDKTAVSENPIPEPPVGAPDPVMQLQAELAAAKVESEQWRDRFLRKAAEFDNYRKRTDKERSESVLLANSSVLTEFLPILDACERALESLNHGAEVQPEIEQYRNGVQLLYKQLRDTLTRIGVVPIDAKGQKFDPNLHEALMRESSSEHEENMVIRELRRGYLFRDRLLRPAQVAVASPPQED